MTSLVFEAPECVNGSDDWYLQIKLEDVICCVDFCIQLDDWEDEAVRIAGLNTAEWLKSSVPKPLLDAAVANVGQWSKPVEVSNWTEDAVLEERIDDTHMCRHVSDC